jgi:hypothetical protein
MKIGDLYHIRDGFEEYGDVDQLIEIRHVTGFDLIDRVHYMVVAESPSRAWDRGQFMELAFELDHTIYFSALEDSIVYW